MIDNSNYAYVRGSSASALDWGRIRFFKPKEFPLEELQFLNKYVIEELDKVREALEIPIYISPVKGAVVRFRETESGNPVGWHDSVKRRQLGQAIDVFIPNSNHLSLVDLLTKSFSLTRFRGIGVYFDTFFKGEPCIMLHFDLRHDPLSWYCPPKEESEKRQYIFSTGRKCYYQEIETLWNTFHENRSLENV